MTSISEIGRSVKCLCCYESFKPERIIRDQLEVDILSDLFSTFSRHMGWESTQEYFFDFSMEQFPFCSPCSMQLVRVFKLDEQIQAMISDLSSKIIFSERRRMSKSNKPSVGTEKIRFFRRQTMNRSPQLLIVEPVSKTPQRFSPKSSLVMQPRAQPLNTGKRFDTQNKVPKKLQSFQKNSRRFKCTLCQASYKCKPHLLRHTLLTHTAESSKAFPCWICGKRYATESLMKDHARCHKNSSSSSNYGKIKSAKKISENVGHQDSVIPSTSKEPPVTPQDKGQRLVVGLRRSLRNQINATTEPPSGDTYDCNVCLQSFSSSSLLSSHAQSCGNGTSSTPSARGNILKKDQEKKKESESFTAGRAIRNVRRAASKHSSPCDDCGKRFATESGLRKHVLKSHTSDKDKKFRCQVCCRRFALKSFLRQHFEVHEKVECNICNNIYSAAGIYNHKYVQHQVWDCSLCSKSFPVNSIKEHVSWHKLQSPGSRPPASWKPRRRRAGNSSKLDLSNSGKFVTAASASVQQ